jgi:hypothetical protein
MVDETLVNAMSIAHVREVFVVEVSINQPSHRVHLKRVGGEAAAGAEVAPASTGCTPGDSLRRAGHLLEARSPPSFK